MKQTNKMLMALTVAGVVAASVCTASAVATIQVLDNPYRVPPGGEFTIIPKADPAAAILAPYISSYSPLALYNGGFQTFCIELGVPVAINGIYEFGISGEAITDPPRVNDPVSVGTAYLYSEFAKGTLAGYFGADRLNQAELLQKAIWMLEDEMAVDLTNPYIVAAVGMFGGLAEAKADDFGGMTADFWGVYALNLGSAREGYPKQDMLIFRTPDGGATVLLMGVAIGGLAFLRRKLA